VSSDPHQAAPEERGGLGQWPWRPGLIELKSDVADAAPPGAASAETYQGSGVTPNAESSRQENYPPFAQIPIVVPWKVLQPCTLVVVGAPK
jgi:hypothetical protein